MTHRKSICKICEKRYCTACNKKCPFCNCNQVNQLQGGGSSRDGGLTWTSSQYLGGTSYDGGKTWY